MRHIRALLGARSPGWTSASAPPPARQAVACAMTLVRAYYICLLFLFVDRYPSWRAWLALRQMRLLWPIEWFQITGTRLGVGIVLSFSIAAALAAAASPHRRILRAASAVGALLFGAFFNAAFGVINHGWHAWILVGGVFVLLPDGDLVKVQSSRRRSHRYLRVFWGAQATFLLFYSMSGAFKLLWAILQWSRGEVTAFNVGGMPLQLAGKLIEVGPVWPASQFGAWLIEHPHAAWLLLVSTMYLESFSILVAFRPTVHRFWGISLILMHLGAYLFMDIMFSWQMILLGLLLVCSPFAPARSCWRETILSLPVFGDAWAFAGRFRGRLGLTSRPKKVPAPEAVESI